MKSIPAVVSFIVAASAFSAQSQPPAPVPAAKCEKPAGGPGLDPSNYERQQRFQKKVDEYKDCINKYAQEMRTQSDAYFEAGKQYTEAGNAAVDQYNAFVLELNKQYGKKGDDKEDPARTAVPSTGTKPGKY